MNKSKIYNTSTVLLNFLAFITWFTIAIGTLITFLATNDNLSTLKDACTGQDIQSISLTGLISSASILNIIFLIFIICLPPVKIILFQRKKRRNIEKFLNMMLAVKIQEEFNESYPDYKGFLKVYIQRNWDNNYTDYEIELNMSDAIIIKEYVMIPEEDKLYDRGVTFWNGLAETFDKMIERFECTHTAEQ